jgi:hypothetical protein
MNLHRIAFEVLYQNNTLRKGKPQDAHACRNAALSLAHHLRAHGLSATVGYGLVGDNNTQSIIAAFVDALHIASPIQGHDAATRAQTLKTEDHSNYLLHSRLALLLADGFSLAAKALWPTEDNTQESRHA